MVVNSIISSYDNDNCLAGEDSLDCFEQGIELLVEEAKQAVCV